MPFDPPAAKRARRPRLLRIVRCRVVMALGVVDGMGPLVVAGMLGLAAMVVLVRRPLGQNSDGLIQTLFSIQDLTLFYWGQDRFANLLPALAQFITDPAANASAQLAARIGLGLCAPLFFCVLATRTTGSAWRATLAASALLLAAGTNRILHETLIEASPYGTSLALAGFALLAFRRARQAGAWRLPLQAAGVALAYAAYMVNVSLMLVTLPLVAAYALVFGSVLAIEFGVASVLALGLTAAAMASSAQTAHTSLGFAETTIGVVYYAGQLAGRPGRLIQGVLVAGAAILAVLAWRRDRRLARHAAQAAILIATGIATIVAMGLSSWVVFNFMHPRYLVPAYVLFAALGGLALAALAQNLLPPRAGRLALLAVCGALLFVGVRRVPPVSPDRLAIIDPAWRPLADALGATIHERGLDAIAGEYWDVWPGVFQAEQIAHDLGRPAGQVFGIAMRGEVRRGALAARLLDRGRLRVGCIGIAAPDCHRLVNRRMALPATDYASGGDDTPLPDGRTVAILVMTRPVP